MCIGGSSKIARTAEAVLRPLHAGLFGSGSAGLGGTDALPSLHGRKHSDEALLRPVRPPCGAAGAPITDSITLVE